MFLKSDFITWTSVNPFSSTKFLKDESALLLSLGNLINTKEGELTESCLRKNCKVACCHVERTRIKEIKTGKFLRETYPQGVVYLD